MSKEEDINKIIDYLEWLVENVNTVLGKDEKYTIVYVSGLCPNIEKNLEDITLGKYIDVSKWEEFSGNYAYPVKSYNNTSTPKEYYRETLDVYSGEYGAARIRLAKWIINELKNKIT